MPFFRKDPPAVEGETPPVQAAPVAPAPSAPAPAGEGDLWPRLLNSYKSRLPAMNRAFLDSAWGVMEGDLLTVICASDLTKNQLHNDKVQAVLQEVTSAAAGRPIAVTFSVGKLPSAAKSPAAQPEDKLDALIGLGSQFDNFKVK